MKELERILEKLRVDVIICVFDYQKVVGKNTKKQIKINDKCNNKLVPQASSAILALVKEKITAEKLRVQIINNSVYWKKNWTMHPKELAEALHNWIGKELK